MNVAFAFDPGNADGTKGGAELAMEAFVKGRPKDVEVTGKDEADVLVVGNCVGFTPDLLNDFDGRVIRYHHDLARSEPEELRQALEDRADHIFTSPLHVEKYGWTGDHQLIPPCPDLARFKPNRETRRHTKREGIVSVGAWQSPGKGGHLVDRVALEQGVTIHAFGNGHFPPAGPGIDYHGPVDPTDLPTILWKFEQFVYLPFAVEPFGRCVAEAYAAGCEVLTNDLVGAKWWIENEPDKMFTANDDFWSYVCG